MRRINENQIKVIWEYFLEYVYYWSTYMKFIEEKSLFSNGKYAYLMYVYTG